MVRSIRRGGKKKFEFKPSINVARKKKAKLAKQRQSKTTSTILAQEWKGGKSARINMKALGIAYDPNEVVMATESKSKASDDNDVELMDVASVPSVAQQRRKTAATTSRQRRAAAAEATLDKQRAARVVAALEESAKREEEKQKVGRKAQLKESDIEFCIYMLTKYDEDTEAMARDHRNVWQWTPAQIARKLRIYKQSSYYKLLNGGS